MRGTDLLGEPQRPQAVAQGRGQPDRAPRGQADEQVRHREVVGQVGDLRPGAGLVELQGLGPVRHEGGDARPRRQHALGAAPGRARGHGDVARAVRSVGTTGRVPDRHAVRVDDDVRRQRVQDVGAALRGRRRVDEAQREVARDGRQQQDDGVGGERQDGRHHRGAAPRQAVDPSSRVVRRAEQLAVGQGAASVRERRSGPRARPERADAVTERVHGACSDPGSAARRTGARS